MVTTVQHSNTVAFPTQSNAQVGAQQRTATRPAKAKSNNYAELRLELSNLLQTTLELPQVLQLFFDEAQRTLSITSLYYQNDKISEAIEFGQKTRHNCHYKLIAKQDSLGEIAFSRNKRFSETELQLLEMLISCLICPIRNTLMYREAVQSALRDPLTGSGNRMALENTLEREIALASRHNHPLSLLVVDIDKFKIINDNYGHAAGDYVLKDVASNLAQCSRETDSAYRAYRFGGEEFVLVLNNTNNEGAILVAERIRQSIENMTTTFEDNLISVSVSVGVASIIEGDNMSSLFSRADKALYRAKGMGRNRVVNAQEYIEKNAS